MPPSASALCRPCHPPRTWALAAALLAPSVGAQTAAADRITQLPPVTVVSPAPLPGTLLPADQLPAALQTATGADIDRRHALDLTDFMNRSLGSVTLNQRQGNPFQPDVNYRGFTASPLLGTPQGLSVYLDGVRLNQPFGDVVSWDLIPRAAISSLALMPGSNPLFGLNTLGGALAIQTKDGLHDAGNSVEASMGSYRRVSIGFESGGAVPGGADWFVTGNRFHERGWRAASPTGVGQLFAKFGTTLSGTRLTLTSALAGTDLTGNGLQEAGALQRDAASVYTVPDSTRNRSLFVNLTGRRRLTGGLELSGNVYWRRLSTATYNGDVNDDALGASIYQPSAAEQAALAGAGYSGYPTAGATAATTPFPKWRCIADALLNTEPNETCDGLVNRTSTRQRNYGAAAQLSAEPRWGGRLHRLLAGVAVDASQVRFAQSARFGTLNPDRSVTPVGGPGASADGSQASENAFDARVDLASRSRTVSAYASDTLAIDDRTSLTVSGRYNRNTVRNDDALTPGGGAGSLDGRYRFSHFNPALGATFAASPGLTAYAGVSRGSRAPTAVELGCADPLSPCKLPNAFAGDPPLKQVVTTTVEAGLRGTVAGLLSWNAGVFRSDNRDDLLFVADDTSGYGYFRNFGRTRRQGVEIGLSARPAEGVAWAAAFSLLDATYRSPEVVDGAGNSSNSSAAVGLPGIDGTIRIQPGNRIALLPRRSLKLSVDRDVTQAWRIGADWVAMSGATARGNENGLHRPDGRYYAGPGRSAGHAVLGLTLEHRPSVHWKVFLQVDNLLDRRYATAAQLGANAFDAQGRYAGRPFGTDAAGNEPIAHGTFYAPGAPRSLRVGVRHDFD